MTVALRVSCPPTDGTSHRNNLDEADLGVSCAYGDLAEAARSYARAFYEVGETTETVQSSATALEISDIEALDAINVEWEAKATLTQGPRNEAGFTAEVKPRTTGDLEVLHRAAEVASLRYQQYRAASLRAELNAAEATRAAEMAEARFLEIARRLAT